MKEELTDFDWEEEIKKSEQSFQETLKKLEEIKSIQNPIIHFIYTLNFHEGSFFNLEDLKGWFNFIKLYFSMFYRPASRFPLDLKANGPVENREIFLLPKMFHQYPVEISGRCKFEGLEFDAWTNGIDFEIVLETIPKEIKLNQLPKMFGRWTSQILVDSLKLNSELDEKDKEFVSTSSEATIYDYILDLKYSFFIIITYPDIQESKEVLKKYTLNKITERIWITNGATFRDDFYPQFKNFFVYLIGHSYEEISSEDHDVLNALICHLKYWAMFQTLDNFTGLLTSIGDIKVRAEVKKIDFIKSLFGREIKHIKIDYLNGIESRLDRFLKFALGGRYRGFEYEESDAYLIRRISGEYFRILNKGVNVGLTKKLFFNFKEDSEEKVKNQFESLIKDFEDRIKETIIAINELENNYYRSYELGLSLKGSELTLISIVIGIIIFIIQSFFSSQDCVYLNYSRF